MKRGTFQSGGSRAIFSDCRKARAERFAANKGWGVFCVKGNGELYAKPSSIHSTEEKAEAEVARMTKLNPGWTFKAVKR